MAHPLSQTSAGPEIFGDRVIPVGVFGVLPSVSGGVNMVMRAAAGLETAFVAEDLGTARAQTVQSKPEAVIVICGGGGCDGLTFLRELNRNWPIPVIVVNTAVEDSSDVALAGIQNGAHIVIDAPSGDQAVGPFANKLTRILWPLLRKDPLRLPDVRPLEMVEKPGLPCAVLPATEPIRALVIGASTGGLRSIGRVLDHLPRNIPPTVIVQHIKPGYLARTATRFDGYYPWNIDMARHEKPVANNQIRFAPDGYHLRIADHGGDVVPLLLPPEEVDHFVPAVDHLFDSAAIGFGAAALGILLTGMGKDGARGLVRMRQTGARCLGEAEESCTVYGMSKEAFDAGGVDCELSADQIGLYVSEILALQPEHTCRARAPRAAVAGR